MTAEYPPLLQNWLTSIPVMQQAVLMGGMRGADGVAKYDTTKYILRWYRRCIIRLAFTYQFANDPITKTGTGSYTGPSVEEPQGYNGDWEALMEPLLDQFVRSLDSLPHHFIQHFRHGVQILGYKHPDCRIRKWWNGLYLRMVNDEHLHPETEAEMDRRLGDQEESWRERCDDAVAD